MGYDWGRRWWEGSVPFPTLNYGCVGVRVKNSSLNDMFTLYALVYIRFFSTALCTFWSW